MKDERSTSPFYRWVVPAGIILVCVMTIFVTTTFDRMPPILKRGIQPSDFPQLVAGLIIALCILSMIIEPVRMKERVTALTLLTIGVLVLFAALVSIDLFIALGIAAAGLSALWGERRPLALLLTGVAIPAAVFFLFDFVFETRFPRGLLTSLWYG